MQIMTTPRLNLNKISLEDELHPKSWTPVHFWGVFMSKYTMQFKLTAVQQ